MEEQPVKIVSLHRPKRSERMGNDAESPGAFSVHQLSAEVTPSIGTPPAIGTPSPEAQRPQVVAVHGSKEPRGGLVPGE